MAPGRGADTTLEEVVEARGPELLRLAGVVGVAAGSRGDEPRVVVLVDPARARLAEIPRELDGFSVDVRPSGGLRAL